MLAEDFKSRESDMRFHAETSDFNYIGFRMDGKAFHTFTKDFKRPYDEDLRDMMNAGAMEAIVSVFTSALFAYIQSDEISIIVPTKNNVVNGNTNLFKNRVEKMVSVASSAVTAGFVAHMMRTREDISILPKFDARAFMLKDLDEVQDYLDWRRLDARKNAVSMAVQTMKTPKELHGLGVNERLEILQGTEFEVLPEWFFNGRMIVKEFHEEEIVFNHNQTGQMESIIAQRSKWVLKDALREIAQETVDSFR